MDNVGVSSQLMCFSSYSLEGMPWWVSDESGHSHPGNGSNESRLEPPAWHHDYEAHANSSPFGHTIGRHKKLSVSSMRTGPQMLGWQRPARRSGRLSDSRVYRTYGTKESRKEGRSSKAIYLAKTPTRWDQLLQVIHEEVWNDRQRSLPMGRPRADSRAQILKEAGLFEGGPETGGGEGAWLQDTELINDDTRRRFF